MSDTPQKLTIDIWSDVMCPWCLVGWGNLSQALAKLDDEIEADIRWRAFELNRDMPVEGEERASHLARKYGRTIDQAKEVQEQMRAAAEAAGVSLDYEGEEPAPDAMMWNTFDAHKLLHWTRDTYGNAKQTALKLALFKAHFNERRRIGDREVLLDLAAEQGLDPDDAAVALDDEAIGHAVRVEQQMAFDNNITGVPAMVVDRAFLIPGAQGADTYVDALRRIATKQAG